MRSYQLIVYLPVLAALIVAAASDLRFRKIPNALTIPLAAAGLCCGLLHWGPVAPMQSLLGLLAGFAMTFILFAIGGTSGGDVKLLAALGAWVGPWAILLILLWSKILGMFLALAQAACQGRLRALFRNSFLLIMKVAATGDVQLREAGSDLPTHCRIDKPLAVAVPTFLATLLVLFVPIAGRIL